MLEDKRFANFDIRLFELDPVSFTQTTFSDRKSVKYVSLNKIISDMASDNDYEWS